MQPLFATVETARCVAAAALIVAGFAILAFRGVAPPRLSAFGFAAGPAGLAASHGLGLFVPALALCASSPASASSYGGALATAALHGAPILTAAAAALGLSGLRRLVRCDPQTSRLALAATLVGSGALLVASG